MLRLGLLLVTIVFIVGCSTKKEDNLMRSYNEKVSYHKELQKTEKIQLYKNGETNVVLIATYKFTKNYEKNDTRDEVFIVGIHAEEEEAADINVNDYKLTVNKKPAKKVTALSADDKRLNKLSFVTEWGSYYLMVFPHVNSKKVQLKFTHKEYGSGTLHFAKVAKYVFTKKGF